MPLKFFLINIHRRTCFASATSYEVNYSSCFYCLQLVLFLSFCLLNLNNSCLHHWVCLRRYFTISLMIRMSFLEPTLCPFKITNRAREAIEKLLAQQRESHDLIIRAYMVKDGYQLTPQCALDTRIDEDDLKYDFSTFKIVIDPLSKIYLSGMQLDLIDGKLQFTNYNPDSFTDEVCETCGSTSNNKCNTC